MIVMLVQVKVKAECLETFKQASLENARQSLQEPGIARFDLVQQIDDPTRFLLYEVYRNAEGAVKHKETAHYQKWREAVAGMMAEPRQGLKYCNLFPDDLNWK